jgi:EAL domain-containing protein (putative c-di-GMP-specific phosphodiesterase class I)
VSSTARFADLGLMLRAAAAMRRTRAQGDQALARELLSALEHEDLRLHYQPMYAIATGAIVGMEALVRWQHPTRGLLPPAEFIEVAESHPDLIDPIGDWVLGTAVAQSAAWRSQYGTPPPRIWVNVSCEQLGSDRLCSVVASLLAKAGVDSTALGVEVTERQLIETSGGGSADLAGLRELGVPLALDDFGTGYASLEYLRRFTFDEIKIDGTFVSGLGKHRTDTAVVSSIIELGRMLELTVVAEGVETQQQHDDLRELGCDSCQGYLLQRPADHEVIGELLRVQGSD